MTFWKRFFGIREPPKASPHHPSIRTGPAESPQTIAPPAQVAATADQIASFADAVKSGDLGTIRDLVKRNPTLVSSKDSHGMAPLHWTAEYGRDDVAELLLANNADVNARVVSSGMTPLHWAAMRDRKRVAELLLANDADVNARAKDLDGMTPLHLAARYDCKDVAALLVAKGAEVDAKDSDGRAPLLYAEAYGHKGVAELLSAKVKASATDHGHDKADVRERETDRGEQADEERRFRKTLERLAEQGISPSDVARVLDSMGQFKAVFSNLLFGGDEDAELAYFPKGIPTRKAIILLGKMGGHRRLHEIARGLPDLVMVEHSIEHPEYYGGGKLPDPGKYHYWHISQNLVSVHGHLVQVRYLSHFPKFEINFKYKDGFTLYSGQRTGTYDIHFLSLGYWGEGPRYAWVFLAAAGFDLTEDEVASIRPGDKIEMRSGKAVIIRGAESDS